MEKHLFSEINPLRKRSGGPRISLTAAKVRLRLNNPPA